jgi:hypothetical protein
MDAQVRYKETQNAVGINTSRFYANQRERMASYHWLKTAGETTKGNSKDSLLPQLHSSETFDMAKPFLLVIPQC